MLQTRDILIKLMKERNCRNYIEVGVWEGETLQHILKNIPELVALGIDAYSPSHYSKDHISNMSRATDQDFNEAYKKAVERCGYDQIEVGNSVEMAETIEDNWIDCILIDAAHDYESCKADILAWIPKVRPGGMICGDDYHLPEVKLAVDEIFPEGVDVYSGQLWVKYI